MKKKISIVIPAYNEEKRILKTLEQIKNYVKDRKEKFEIIIVNDGSVDNTVKVIENFDLNVKVLKNEKNMGKGYSVRRGMLASTGDIILFMDADASADIREFDKFFPYLKDFDIVAGSRKLKKDSIIVKEKFLRRSVGYLGHKLIDLVVRTEVKDLLCAFKVYNKKAMELIFSKQKSVGMASDYEVIYLAEKFGLKIKELPVTWSHKEGGSARFSWYTRALYELLMLKVNDFLGKYN